MSPMNLSASFLLSGSNILTHAYKLVIPIWLDVVSSQIIDSAKNYASRFGSASRKFWYNKQNAENTFSSNIFCSGPFVEKTAWDLEFNVPSGGFKYGDIDPLTGEQFPGGSGKHGSYITLIDKSEAEGESAKAVARTYSKYSGRTVKKTGFFSQAIHKNIGEGVILSEIGRRDLQNLSILLGKEIAQNVGLAVKIEAERNGMVAYIGPSLIATIES